MDSANLVDIGREIFSRLAGEQRNFTIKLWDGSIIDPAPGEDSKFTLAIKSPEGLRRMFSSPDEVSLGEAYIYDDCDIEGDCERVFDLSDDILDREIDFGDKLRLAYLIMKLPKRERQQEGRHKLVLSGKLHSKERDSRAVRYHYDVSNDFFATYLDRNMVYSCGYFRHPEEDIDIAQENKLDYICRKLYLKQGEKMLDIGCGWGALVIHAAKQYGVEAFGITLSKPQADYAKERIKREGLEDRCRVEVLDYRDVDGVDNYDKLVSVGMFEHVGGEMLAEYFTHAYNIVKPGGLFLNHGIASNELRPDRPGRSFSNYYVFPDGELLPINKTLSVAEDTGFEVRDVESLREHYAMTLRHWVRRLEANREKAIGFTDESTYRVWRLYMSGSAHGFDSGRLNVYQTLLVKSGRKPGGLPLTRDGWYK